MNISVSRSAPWDVYTDRASLYAQFRLNYAAELVAELVAEVATHTHLTNEHTVADIGAGTGKLTEHFLELSKRVYCVEPNTAMLAEAVARLGKHPAFVSIPGCAEATGLAGGSVNLIVAAMALDWFDRQAALSEFRRILNPSGWFAIFRYRVDQSIWQRLSSYLDGIVGSAHIERPGTNDPALYLAPGYLTLEKQCSCEETWEQFFGGALSAAGAPMPGRPEYDAFCLAHQRAFDGMSVAGRVHVDYTCTATVGRLLQ